MSASQSPVPAGFPTLAVPTTIDYLSKDFTSLSQAMLAYARLAMPGWNISSEGDFGVALVETAAYGLDILSYYGDRIAAEAYLPTATQRVSILNIAAMLGYVPSNGAPSSGTATFQNTTAAPILVPALTQVVATPADGSAQIIFETQSAEIVAESSTLAIEVVQGVTFSMEPIGTSDGTVAQSFALPNTGVITDTVQVFVTTDTGTEEWQPVGFLIDAGPQDKVFALSTDATGVTSVEFGDGVNGLVPGANLAIYATYRIGSGSAGNLPAGSVSNLVTPIPGLQIAVQADGITPITSAMTGGADAETNDQIRTNAALANQAQLRAVNPADVQSLALMVPGVMLANAVAAHSTSVSLYVAGPGYTAPGPDLTDNLLSFFTGKTMCGMTVSVLDPTVVAIDIGTTSNPVQLAVKDGYLQGTVAANVTAALQAYLTPPTVGFGQLINVSDLYQTILGVEGVAYCVIPVFTREDVTQTGTSSIQLGPGELPTAGQVNLSTSGGIL